MVPLVGVPETIRRGLAPYREVFCRAEGFDHVSRYITGLLLSPNKTLQGIYDGQVWEPGAPRSRRAMHEAVFEAGWAADALMPHHRAVIACEHRGRGREVISLDWTYAVLLKNSADSTQLKSLGLDDCQPNSRCLTMIVAQQPSETHSTNHLTRLPANLRLGGDELVLKTLMIALCMIVNQV